MLTDNSEVDGRDALRVFEDARQFFLSGSAFPVVLRAPVRIVAFQSQSEYAPYRFNANSFGHFLHNGKCDYIVLQNIKPENYEAALHEYTHYAIKQAGFTLPTWLNEGLADLYSSMEAHGQTTVIGRGLPHRTGVLLRSSWMELKTLFAVTPDSPFYQEGSKLPLFYAQSWALTHMLVLDKQYAAGFPKFLQAVSSGVSSSEAFYKVYRKDLKQIEEDFSEYGPHMAANTKSFAVQLGENSSQARVRLLSNDEKDLELADLLASHPTTAPEAIRTLANLERQNPGNPLLEERMGQAAWSMSRVEEARAYFARAIEHGTQDSETIYRYAMMQKQAGAPEGGVMRLLERVVELSPDFDEGRMQLGLLQFNNKKFKDAAQSLSKLRTIKDEWTFAYYSVMAYCATEFNQIEEARNLGLKARESARTAGEQSQMDAFLSYLQARKPDSRRNEMLAATHREQRTIGTGGGL